MYLRDGVLTYAPVAGDPRPVAIVRARRDSAARASTTCATSMAALLAALAAGCQPERCAKRCARFEPMPHRLETVAEIDGVLYVDDSKATNPPRSSPRCARYDRPIVLIAGGRAKGTDFDGWAPRFAAAPRRWSRSARPPAKFAAARRRRARSMRAARWTKPCGARASSRVPATSSCSRRAARRSTCSLRRKIAASVLPRPSRHCGSRPVRSAARSERDARRAPRVRPRTRGAARHVLFTSSRRWSASVWSWSSRRRARPRTREHGDIAYYLKRQLIWLVVGLAALTRATASITSACEALAPYLLLAAIVGLLLVFVPHVGVGVNGGRRWIGASAFSFEPSEFAKLALVIYLAAMLSTRGERITSLVRGLVPLCVPVAIMAVLVLKEPDMGTASLLVFAALTLFFAAGARIVHLVAVVLAMVPLPRSSVLASPYRRARIFAFLDPWKDPQNTGFHIVQSLLALGSGGIFGVGLGASRAKFFYLPEQYTDFIFSVLGEELGLVGRSPSSRSSSLRLSRDQDRARRARPVRLLPRGRLRGDDRDSGLHQHRRRDVVVAGDRRSAAVHLVRRQLAGRQSASPSRSSPTSAAIASAQRTRQRRAASCLPAAERAGTSIPRSRSPMRCAQRGAKIGILRDRRPSRSDDRAARPATLAHDRRAAAAAPSLARSRCATIAANLAGTLQSLCLLASAPSRCRHRDRRIRLLPGRARGARARCSRAPPRASPARAQRQAGADEPAAGAARRRGLGHAAIGSALRANTSTGVRCATRCARCRRATARLRGSGSTRARTLWRWAAARARARSTTRW